MMKQIRILPLIALTLLCTGCAPSKAKRVPTQDEIKKEIHEQIRAELFLDNLPTDEDGRPVYPDSYAGDYFGMSKWFFKVTDLDCVSEYQYLKDAYPDIEFREAKYSYNYLQSVLDEYIQSDEMNPEELLPPEIDCSENRVVVYVKEERFADKHFDSKDPLIFKPYIVVVPL